MNEPITWQVVLILVAMVGGVLGIWARVENRVRQAELVTAELQRELTDFQIKSAQSYASLDRLKDVEARLTTAVERLTNRIEGLPTKLAEEFQRMNSIRSRRT